MLISMALAALLTMSDDREGDFDVYIWKLNGIVISVCVFRFLLWCARNCEGLEWQEMGLGMMMMGVVSQCIYG